MGLISGRAAERRVGGLEGEWRPRLRLSVARTLAPGWRCVSAV